MPSRHQHSPRGPRRRIAVVGGGMSGLAAAHRLVELNPSRVDVTLFESTDRLGGIVQTIREDGFLVERGADSFTTGLPWAIDLCHRIGFQDQLIRTNESMRRALVVHRGRLYPIPSGFVLMAFDRLWPMLRSPILSRRGKLRLACERCVPRRRSDDDESVASFARRRLGREAFDRLVQPLVGGIYAADAEQLSMEATLPQFVQQEREFGSLMRACRRANRANSSPTSDSGARYRLFVTSQDGLSALVHAVAERLPQGTVQLNQSVRRITRTPMEARTPMKGCDMEGWELELEHQPTHRNFDAVILATPVLHAARLTAEIDEKLANELQTIPQSGTAVVNLGFRRHQVRHPLDAFGFVVPAVEGRSILAASFSSTKYPNRAPSGNVLIRVFVGSALQAKVQTWPDDQIRSIAIGELDELLGVEGEPIFSRVDRWHHAMPQYHLNHLQRVRRIEERIDAIPGLAIAGNAYRGVGIPQCIHSGEVAAENVLAEIDAADSR